MPSGDLPSAERFASFDGLHLAYYRSGSGPTVVLLHGFGSSSPMNWFRTQVAGALVASGRAIVALDARGHGASEKPHDPAAYGGGAMVRDVGALVDHLGLEAVDVCGYSMGALTARAFVAGDQRSRSVVLGGIGERVVGPEWRRSAEGIAAALEAEDPATVASPLARSFRAFVDRAGGDRLALAAVQRARGQSSLAPGPIRVPALVLVGEADLLAGSPESLAATIPGARVVAVPGDHLTAVLAPAFRKAVVDFLAEVSTVDG